MTKHDTPDSFAVQIRPIADLRPYARNARTHSEEQVEEIVASMLEFGWTNPILATEEGEIVAGHGRRMAAELLYSRGGRITFPGKGGPEIPVGTVPVIDCTGWTDEQRRAYTLMDNASAEHSGWDADLLRAELESLVEAGFNMDLAGFDEDALAAALAPPEINAPAELKIKLSDRFGIAPFSVFNAREGWWQNRKRAWLSLGIQSEVGRGENPLRFLDTINKPDPEKRARNRARAIATTAREHSEGWKERGSRAKGNLWHGGKSESVRKVADVQASGTSIFDPVLCELAYRWFCPPGGAVLDPFAGGSVRGIVAARLGLGYTGIDLRPEQTEANREQAARIVPDNAPAWLDGDALDVGTLAPELEADFLFSCPPYADLEVYSEDPRDLSTMAYADFRATYFRIIEAAAAKLRPDRFACFVVGEVRAKGGGYYGFVPDTIAAFEAAGLRFYNEAILITAAGSLPIRAGKQFASSRKLGKALRNGTPVLTPKGWRRIEDLCAGDLVVAGDGSTTVVTGTYPQGERSLWRVSFDDGTFVDADAEHLWTVDVRIIRGGTERITLTTAEMTERWGSAPLDPRPIVPLCGAVEVPHEPIPVHPYLVGLLLGDGGLTGNTPILSTADAEVVGALPDLMPAGTEVKSRGYDYRLVGAGSRSLRNPLTMALRDLGMMGCGAGAKRVPACYLWNDTETRLQTYRGLMDSDGTVNAEGSSGVTEFSTISSGLAEDVAFLARSLGAKASIHQANRVSGHSWRVRVRGGPNPFALKRKADRWAAWESRRTRRLGKRVRSILPAGRDKATCIAVDHPDRLFVAKDFIVTHNTHQNVLVFLKGDHKRAVQALGEVVEFGEIGAEDVFDDTGGFDVA